MGFYIFISVLIGAVVGVSSYFIVRWMFRRRMAESLATSLFLIKIPRASAAGAGGGMRAVRMLRILKQNWRISNNCSRVYPACGDRLHSRSRFRMWEKRSIFILPCRNCRRRQPRSRSKDCGTARAWSSCRTTSIFLTRTARPRRHILPQKENRGIADPDVCGTGH